MSKLISFYRLINVLSIDVAVGSVCCAAWFAALFDVKLKPYALLSLGITVWIIYTIDHLLDARKVKAPASTVRHRFHQKYFSSLLAILVLALLVDLVFVFFLRKRIFQWGVVLSGVMLVYFLTERYLQYLKEFIIALLFSCGVLLPSLSLTQKQPDISMVLLICQFVLTALLNLLLFSWFDRQNDNHDNRASIVTLAGERRIKLILVLTFITNYSLMIGSIVYASSLIGEVLIMFFMNTILVFVFVRPQWFEINDRFRLAGDSIFLLPVLYFFL